MESFALLLRWLEQPDARAWQDNALALALSTLVLDQRRSPATIAAAREALAEGLEPPPSAELTHTAKAPMLATWRRRGHAHLLSSLPFDQLVQANPGQLRLQLRLFDGPAQRNAEGFGADWRAFLQAWNLLQFHEVQVSSTERLLAAQGEAPPAPPEPPPQHDGPVPSAPFLALLDEGYDYPELFQLLSERALPAPEDPSEEFVLGGRDAEVELLWPELQLALLSDADARDRQHYRDHGWQLFDPEADDPSAIVSAVARARQDHMSETP